MTRSALAPLVTALLAGPAAAQSGGYGGPVVGVSSVNDESVLMFGGRGGWLIDHKFLIGGAGYGMANSDLYVGPADGTGARPHLTLGYGGIHFAYTHASRSRWHLSAHTLFGAGSLGLDGGGADSSDSFTVVEPGAGVVFDAGTNVRLGLDAGYRFASGVALPGFEKGDVSGFALSFAVHFGSF